MKICTKCNLEKELSLFSIKDKKKSRYSPVCKQCHSILRKDHYTKNKKYYQDKALKWKIEEKIKFFNWLKTKACLDCGNSDFRVLEFDHLENKEFNISQKIGDIKFETILVEVEKCDIVCANCHRIRTAARANYYKYLE